MKKYLNHVKTLYKRPVLNGIDGKLQKRSSSPFELFFDLIFVIVLSKLNIFFTDATILTVIQAILLYAVIYSIWFTLTTYTVMFLKKEINYWSRFMFFIIMIPIIVFLSVDNLNSSLNNAVFYMSLASSKLILALIFKDSIINAPLNNITVSNVYMIIARTQTLTAILLMVNAFVTNVYIQLLILLIVALREYIYTPYITRKIIDKQNFHLPINYELFMERQMLFIILVFGESLVSLIETVHYDMSLLSLINIFIIFTIMFLFYTRVSEESELNDKLIANSNNMFHWFQIDLAIFILFQILTEAPNLINTHEQYSWQTVVLLIFILIYICSSHLHYDLEFLKEKKNPVARLFYVTDVKMIMLMYGCIVLIAVFHKHVQIINLLLLLFFGLHVLALPFRESLISDKCELRKEINKF